MSDSPLVRLREALGDAETALDELYDDDEARAIRVDIDNATGQLQALIVLVSRWEKQEAE